MATGIIKMLHLQLNIKFSCCTYSVLIHSIIPVSVCVCSSQLPVVFSKYFTLNKDIHHYSSRSAQHVEREM